MANWDLVKVTARLSREIRRQVAVVIDRKGDVTHVVVGDHRSVQLPPLSIRTGPSRLSGYRWIHTHLSEEGLNRRDLTSLLSQRLDLVASVAADLKGFPGLVHVAHLAPQQDATSIIRTLEPVSYPKLNLEFDSFVAALEEEFQQKAGRVQVVRRENRAILCAIALSSDKTLEEDLEETKELARTVGLEIADVVVQGRDKPDPKYLVGRGKLDEILLHASQHQADLLLFQQNLSSNQSRHLNDATPLRVIDRTQLILDIFAQRANSHDGKLQVELAQLRYTLPRLREFGTQLSRLVGGIGGRGPGETKLEIHRRRAHDRMNRLEREINQIAQKRAAKRALRRRKNVPVVSIVGYTNAGKSTLLNSLTYATALVEDKPFATLDPFSKRLRFPQDRELILTDTVGFIRNLPPDLIAAFRATLEEIGEADLLLHVLDISGVDYSARVSVVDGILRDLGFEKIPQILVCNKADRLEAKVAERIAYSLGGVAVSALKAETCKPLLDLMEAKLWQKRNPGIVAEEAVSY